MFQKSINLISKPFKLGQDLVCTLHFHR